MWTIRDQWTSRAQVFRDEQVEHSRCSPCAWVTEGRDTSTAPKLTATEAWAQFFPKEQAPPIPIVNVLNPQMKLQDSPQIQTLHFDRGGLFDYHHAADTADIETLNRLGAEWDEGADFVPYTPPAPKYTRVWRRFPVKDLPQRRLFRDMDTYMTADWGHAVQTAIEAIQTGGQIPADVPPSVAAAARTLLYESIELAREGGRAWYINGQHRTEAMLRQGVQEAVLIETRLLAEPPLPGELGQAGGST